MVGLFRIWQCRTARVVLALLAATACDKPVSLLGNTKEPSLYLVLSADPEGADSSLYGLLGNTTDSAQLRYRSVEKIELRRRSDGALYGWLVLPRNGVVPLVVTGGSLTAVANIKLPWNSNAGGLGRSGLTKGDTYDLTIQSEGKEIVGVATLPPALTVAIRQVGGSREVVWNLLEPRYRYNIRVPIDTSDDGFRAETTYTIKADAPKALWPPNPRVVVTALDLGYVKYLTDSTVVAAGLSGAIGVFSGVSVTAVPLDMGAPNARELPRRRDKAQALWRPNEE